MKLILSHPTGNEFVRAAAHGFQERKLLFEFCTSIASFKGSFLDLLGNLPSFSEIHRRRYEAALRPITRTYPVLEVCRHLSIKTNSSRFIRHETGIFSIDAVYRHIDRKTAARLQKVIEHDVHAVYAYEDAAICSFNKAKQHHLKCFYDLPIGYWRASRNLLEKERELWPEWAATLTGLDDSDDKLARKDEELLLADRIFVASQFTATTLQDYPGTLAPIEIIPYAFPPVNTVRSYSERLKQKPLKLLFVGGLSQRKGIANLFAAVNTLRHHVELTIVGHKVNDDCPQLNIELAKHKWIPSMHHLGILEIMRAHDVLVFPSLFEGFGLVISEAMSQGTPVITTDRTAGPDIIQHGNNGWLIEAGSTQALIEAIEELLYHSEYIPEVGREAMETAQKRTWQVYGRELAAAVERTLIVAK